ncbi:MAG TPA: tetratricopeptide repeat protein [Chthonomonadaceae bacterium]|nr:tetratricopeptide repeat protein [Chthonomonadaceae bacterium]
MDALFRVEMLGRFAVWQGNREITRFRTQKTASLLAYLSLYRARSHPRETLIECFWPDSPLEAARTNLSVALNALRRQLEPPGVPAGAVLMTTHAQVRLNPIAFTSDVDDFESLLQEAPSATPAEKRMELWRSALDLYRGDLLPAHYEEWVLTERDRLREAYQVTLRQVIKEYAEGRHLEQALVYAHRLVQADPLREESYRNLMRLYAALGRPGEAVSSYQELERLLQKQLQASPSSATRELAEQLGNMAPRPRPARAAVSLQKEAVVGPALAGPDTNRPPFKIPMQLTRFFGREETLAQLVQGIHVPPETVKAHDGVPEASGGRLWTVTGPGGTGKTRFSIEVAGRLKETFRGGIWFVPLAEVNDPLLIGEALRDVLELRPQSQTPVLEQVIAYLGGLQQPSLLVLDNFEQISAGGASVVWTLLQRVDRLCCLVTSRRPLSLPGEREIPLAPLPAPTLETDPPASSLLTTHLLSYASVALFVDRAQTARPDFQITPKNAQAIAAICQRVEGLPLAIELVASRVKVLTPSQIEERLAERFELLASKKSDREERHRSLWAAIDWSYHLLAPDLQRLFARLSVFRGGWNLEAAEAVCEEPMALEYLSQLRAHSLILTEESTTAIRFRMLETIREFAAEQLSQEERAKTQQRHATYFHQRVVSEPSNRSNNMAWIERLDEDLDNLRSVLAWSLQEGSEFEIGFQMVGKLFTLWRIRGHLSEGRRWYARFLERAGETPAEWLCRVLYGAGTLAALQGDFQAAQPLLERCLEVAQTGEDQGMMAHANNELGSIHYRLGDYARARSYYERYLALARAQGNRLFVASALGNLANVAQSAGDFAASRVFNEESLEIWREEGDRPGEAITLHNLANLAHSEGHLAEARAYFEQSVAIKRELADPYSLCWSLTNLAHLEKDQQDYTAATAHACASLVLARKLNARMNLVEILYLLIGLVQINGELEIAARMCGTMEKVREQMNFPMTPVMQDEYDRMKTALSERLGTTVYEAAKMEGRTLSLEEALTCLEETLANRSL